jgi:hypothetical protein
MRYAEFEVNIEKLAAAATPERRRRFALDTIGLLYQAADAPARGELNGEELRQFAALMEGVEISPPDVLAGVLASLNESMCRDPVRAIEFHPDITELLCAIDHWIGYRRSGDPHRIAGLAINRVNSVDYAIGGDVGEYSTDNMLGAAKMVAEVQRQQRLLIPAEPLYGLSDLNENNDSLPPV